MPWIDIAVTLLMVAALIVGMTTRRRPAAPVVVLGSAALLLLAIAFVLEGPRLPLIAAAIAGAAGGGIVLWARSGKVPRLASAASVVLAFGLVGIAGAAWALPPMSVPAPTGPHPVGVASHLWTDSTRDARGGSTPGQERSLPVTVWYPAAEPGPGSAYLPVGDESASQLPSALAQQYGVPSILLDGLRNAKSNASAQAAPAQGSFPVVVASPGFASSRWFFTSWAEQLASNGVIVVALDHPYDAIVAELADGSLAYDESQATGDDATDQANADRAASVRAADIRAVIGKIETAPTDAPELTAADLTMFIAAGHSAGGAAAIEAARLDDRIKGVVNIDGMPRSPAGTRLVQPLLVVVSGDMDPNPGYETALNGLLAGGNGARVTLDGVAHFGMVDIGRLIGPVPGVVGVNGPAGARLAAQATLELVKAADAGAPIDAEALRRWGSVE